jgi:hypothetical protein
MPTIPMSEAINWPAAKGFVTAWDDDELRGRMVALRRGQGALLFMR